MFYGHFIYRKKNDTMFKWMKTNKNKQDKQLNNNTNSGSPKHNKNKYKHQQTKQDAKNVVEEENLKNGGSVSHGLDTSSSNGLTNSIGNGLNHHGVSASKDDISGDSNENDYHEIETTDSGVGGVEDPRMNNKR